MNKTIKAIWQIFRPNLLTLGGVASIIAIVLFFVKQ